MNPSSRLLILVGHATLAWEAKQLDKFDLAAGQKDKTIMFDKIWIFSIVTEKEIRFKKVNVLD